MVSRQPYFPELADQWECLEVGQVPHCPCLHPWDTFVRMSPYAQIFLNEDQQDLKFPQRGAGVLPGRLETSWKPIQSMGDWSWDLGNMIGRTFIEHFSSTRNSW